MAESWAKHQLLPQFPQKIRYSGLERVEGEGLGFQTYSCSLTWVYWFGPNQEMENTDFGPEREEFGNWNSGFWLSPPL